MTSHRWIPLAEQLRPTCLADIVGQEALLGQHGTIRQMLDKNHLPSIILWGTPGVGKTTLARVLAHAVNADLLEFSGAQSHIKTVREAVNDWLANASDGYASKKSFPQTPQAASLFEIETSAPDPELPNRQKTAFRFKKLVVFVDEIHRYNKAQQDYFLPWIEQGHFTLIGATTENPGFEINNALLSRTHVMVLQPLDHQALRKLLERALHQQKQSQSLTEACKSELIELADGDARRLLNDVDRLLQHLENTSDPISVTQMRQQLGRSIRRFDKGGDSFYDQISALHKSVRGSDPDASLYWFTRMIDGGCDPLYIARRMIRIASEDIGLADPYALPQTIAATEAYERLGNPEGILALAQAIVYLAMLPKSNALYRAYQAALDFVHHDQSRPVPLAIRNAPTQVQRKIGAGKDYRYAHNEPHAYAADENYWPDGLTHQSWYHPTDRGLEKRIAERIQFLRNLDQQYKDQRSSHSHNVPNPKLKP